MNESMKIAFYGDMAQNHELDLYDAGRSIGGLGRTMSILSNYYETGKIITQAPSSRSKITLKAPDRGSFLLDVAANVAGGVIAAPVILYITQVCTRWLPGGVEQDKARMRRMEADLRIKGEQIESLQKAIEARDNAENNASQLKEVSDFINNHQKEHDVMRSILANSFVDIFRPIGRSADYSLIYGNNGGEYIGCVNKAVVDDLDVELPDDKISSVNAIVDSFSRKSKKGIAFSNELGRGFRFSSASMGKLGKEDDFSWSQYKQEEIMMTGRFYFFFDGSIKRLEVFSVERDVFS